MIKLMELELTSIPMGLSTTDSGKMTSSMAKASRLGLMVQNTKAITNSAGSTELDATTGTMVLSMLEIGSKTKYQA
jgi:hypothetical protein